ncbi:MAG: hypothetical protein AAFR84_02935 [Pseudomonadota bacterium]
MTTSQELRILVIREAEMLVAQCLEYDICTQAKDLNELKERMDVLIDLECEESTERSGKPFGDIDPAPQYFHDMWDAAIAFERGERPYDMAMAA